MHIEWLPGTATRILDQLLDVNQIGNANEITSPSDFPFPNPLAGTIGWRTIAASSAKTLTINFQTAPGGSPYVVIVHFDIGCQVSVSK